jgi:pyruvate/2-oxoglutarate dehydrogenase complex dihydrolipoamide dehydrogenase (E3) component
MIKKDIIVIGMGPAGMSVSAMASAMGLDVLAIEKHKVGGECLNVGCIPSKALLKAAEVNSLAKNLQFYGIEADLYERSKDPMSVVRDKISGINNKKFMKVFEKVDLVIGKGHAHFLDDKIVEVDGKRYTAKAIFIATGTQPFIPPIPGLAEVPKLTNMNMFELEEMPKSLTIIGGGAIGTEMAQAFSRLGTKVNLVHQDAHLVPAGDAEAGKYLEECLVKEDIGVFNNEKITKVEHKDGIIYTYTDKRVLESQEILVATGRQPLLANLQLDNAKIAYNRKGIIVDEYGRTNKKHIYAVGDCNGHNLFSHAAMHQGMLSLMHFLSPMALPKLKRSNYVVPWSVFTKPEVAQVGLTEKEAKAKGIKYQVVKKEYKSYGRTVADGHPQGFIKILTNARGKIFGASIVGEAASELIHEWTMAIQYKKSLLDIMMMMHSFPSISMLNKMVAEDWMMNAMDSKLIKKSIKMLA